MDGSRYLGEWYKGVQHGFGKMIFADGRVKEGIFENNVYRGSGRDETPREEPHTVPRVSKKMSVPKRSRDYTYAPKRNYDRHIDLDRLTYDSRKGTIEKPHEVRGSPRRRRKKKAGKDRALSLSPPIVLPRLP